MDRDERRIERVQRLVESLERRPRQPSGVRVGQRLAGRSVAVQPDQVDAADLYPVRKRRRSVPTLKLRQGERGSGPVAVDQVVGSGDGEHWRVEVRDDPIEGVVFGSGPVLDEVAVANDGVDDAQASAEFQELLDVQSRFHDYSYRNTLLITTQCPECENSPSYHEDTDCEYDETPPEEWSEGLVGVKPVPVFDGSQTEGEPLEATS